MKVTLQVKGMMCQHCVAHVKKALEAVPGVSMVNVSLDENKADVEGENLQIEALKKAVVDAGYEVE